MPNEISLREYFDVRLKEIETATSLAKVNLERRLDELNKLRADVVEDRQTFVTAAAYDAAEQARNVWREQIRDTVNALANRMTIVETRSVTWTAALGVGLTIVQALIGVILYWLIHPHT